MSSITAINDEQWSKLLKHVAQHYNEVTLSRGFNYYKQQRVVSLHVSESRIVQAKVEGSEDYKVMLNLDKPRSSYCTCPVQTSCKHQAAVLMELGDRYGYPASQVVNAKQYYRKATAVVPSIEHKLKQLPELDVSGWHKLLAELTAHIKPAYDQGIYVQMLQHYLQGMSKTRIPLSDTDRIFFELHRQLFVLHKIQEQNAQGSVNYYTSFAVYRVYDEIYEWMRKQAAGGMLGEHFFGERLEQTLRYIRQLMAQESGYKFQTYRLYVELWKSWISPHAGALAWASQELKELEQSEEKDVSPSTAAAMAFLHMQTGNIGEAWEALEASGALKQASAELLLLFLQHLSDTGQWTGLTDWLTKSLPVFENRPGSPVQAYIHYWKKAVEHLPEAESQMWYVLEQLLPYSSGIIEDMLYEARNWKPWIEMQIIQGHDPLYHSVSDLKPIEKDSPSLLLPYYHQAIEHYVALKNRYDYKQGVKLLKRLEKLYKKMKQPERWERFFTAFVERNSRLRALQEELRKGKLLP